MAQISYAQALKNGIVREQNKKTLNYKQMLNRLEQYYGGSDTFFGKNNGILSKIMKYRFNSCLGCAKLLDKIIVCKNCIQTKTILVDNQIFKLCLDCNRCHSSSFEIQCDVCKKDSTNMFNVNGTDICSKCLNFDLDFEEVD